MGVLVSFKHANLSTGPRLYRVRDPMQNRKTLAGPQRKHGIHGHSHPNPTALMNPDVISDMVLARLFKNVPLVLQRYLDHPWPSVCTVLVTVLSDCKLKARLLTGRGEL